MDRRVTPPKRVTSPTWGPPPPSKQALRGFGVKIANFSRLHCLAIPKRDLSTKKTKPKIEKLEKWPESLGVIVQF